MARTCKSAILILLLVTIGLLAAVVLLTQAPWTNKATAQSDLAGFIPVKTQLPEPTSQTFSAAQTYFSAQALVFVPLSSEMAYYGGLAGCKVSAGVGDYFAPVNIPHGSIVDAMEVVYYVATPDTGQMATVTLAMGTDTGGWQTLSPLNLSIRSSGFHLQAISVNHTINTYNNSYSLYWFTGGSDIELCQARLYYRPPASSAAYLPIINK